jgi:undecaprenyl diphosphate synthase
MPDLPDRLPRHVAAMMDGNGRWAQQRGLPRTEGHKAGAQSARTIAEACIELGIPALTLFAFSTENWRRPRAEVSFLMSNLRSFLHEHGKDLVKNGICLRPIGALDGLPADVRRELDRARDATREGTALTLAVAVNYGARREIADAARAIARKVKAGELEPDAIDEDTVEQHLYTAGLPAPELVIRTGGEMRLSNFLLWQVSYAEFYVTETLWPDFGRDQFIEALREFGRRDRRFGGLNDEESGKEPTA